MRQMIRSVVSVVALAVLLGVASPAHAQGPPTTRPGEGPAPMLRQARQLLEELQLTQEQREKVDDIFREAGEKFRAAREQFQENDTPGPERMQRVGEMLRSLREEVAAVLDEQQREAFEKRLGEMRQQAQRRVGDVVQRLEEAAAQLQLSEEQKEQIAQIISDLRGKMRELREQGREQAQEMREQFRAAMQQAREQIESTLTEEQRQKLRELMRPGATGDEPRPRGRGGATTRPQARAQRPEAPLAAGDAAPDFQLQTLDGKPMQLSSLKGRVVVLEFGSYSCPIFRGHVDAMEKLKRDYGSKATFVLLYTKEAHPVGGREVRRNREEGINVEQPADLSTRRTLAKKARDDLKISLSVVVDDMDNATSAAYGGFPNAAVVVGRDGTIVARQQWTDPSALRRHIDAALNAGSSRVDN